MDDKCFHRSLPGLIPSTTRRPPSLILSFLPSKPPPSFIGIKHVLNPVFPPAWIVPRRSGTDMPLCALRYRILRASLPSAVVSARISLPPRPTSMYTLTKSCSLCFLHGGYTPRMTPRSTRSDHKDRSIHTSVPKGALTPR